MAIKALSDMQTAGKLSGIWHVFAPLISEFSSVTLRWIPGHMGILGNDITDRLAQRACDLDLEPGRFAYVDFGFCSYEKIHENRMASWRLWHTAEGHSYYGTARSNYRHPCTMLRLDFYALFRIRSGTGMTSHNGCIDKEDTHHWILSTRYLDGRPAAGCLYDNKKVQWWIR